MVEELKLAIKIDDASIEQSLLKQFANAQKMADKVVLDFKNVNFDDKQIEAKFKEMQKKAGQNPIDLTIGGNTLDMLGQIDKRLTEIFGIGKGKSFIDSSSTVADIGKIENKINELNKKYEEMQKKLSSVGSEGISGKDVSLIDNAEFQKLSQEVSELKNQFDDLKAHMQLLDDYTVPTDRFFELQTQIEATSVKVSDLVDEMIRLSNIQKNIGAETNISSENGIDDFNTKLQESKKYVNEIRQAFMSIVGKASNRESLLNQYPELGEFKNRTNIDKARSFLNTDEWKDFLSTLPQAHTYLESIGYDFDRIYKLSDEEIKWFKDLSPEELLSNGWYDKKLDQSQLKEIRAAYQNTMKDAFPDKDISASVESATNSIKEENNILEQNTQKIKENTQAKEQNANVNLNKYDKRLDSYNGKVNKYQATIARFNDGGWTSSTYLENVQAVKNAVHEYETLLNELKGKDASLVTSDDISKLDNYEKKIKDTIATVTNMSASEKGYNFVSGQKELDKIHKLLNENSKMSSEAKAKIKAYYKEIESGNPSMSLDRIHGEIMKIYNAEVEAGRAGRSFFDTLKNSGFHQIAAQMAGMFGVYDVINVIKQTASTVTELNTQITELAKVSEQSSSQIYADFDSYADIAKEVRGTISDTIAATADWSKNGYSIPDAKQLAEISQLYKNVGDGIDIDTANESLISTLKGFQLEADQAEHIVDVFNEVSNNEAISSGGIGEALQRSAASFNAASTSLEKSVSLVTATNSVLQNPEKVGNMWRTVSARLRGSETELKEMGEDTDGLVTSTSKLQALVKGITGFDIMKDKDTYKDIYDIVLGIGEKWKDLSDIDRASLLEALAGKQQSNALAAALSNIDILKKSYEEATHAEGSAREENEEYSKSIQASIDLAQAKLEQLANDTLNSNFLKGAIDAGGKLIDVLDGIVKSGNAIPAVATAISAALSFKNVGIGTLVAYQSNHCYCFDVPTS